MPKPLTMLVVDDSEDDTDLLVREVRLGGYDPTYRRVDTPDALKAALFEQEWNLIIGDYTMPRFSGTEALSIVRGTGIDTPFIFVSGTIGEDQAVAAMKAGAQDYLIKGQLKRLVPAIERELREAEFRSERARAIAKLQQLSRAVEQSANLVIISNVDGFVEYINPKFLETMGYAAEDVIGQRFSLWMSGQASESDYQKIWDTIHSGHDWRGGFENRREDGSIVAVAATISPIKDESGHITHFISIQEDVTQRREIEEQLRRAQRIESIGQLTGGLAHDFNNLLSIIVGNLDLLHDEVKAMPSAQPLVDAAMRASLRGADLTRNLLAFARRQSLEANPFSLAEMLLGMADMLKRTLGEQIEVRMDIAADLWPVFADATQVESACLNLAINARDAMPNGGRLTIEARNALLDADYATSNAGVTPGEYVELAVSDTGTGIPPEVIGRVFEPFFTTKEKGKGTGLGLSMIYGFVRQSGGHVKIHSEVGRGTILRLYLPRADALPGAVQEDPVAEPTGEPSAAIILVVEDNPDVRKVAVAQLASLGYRTVEAEDAASALTVLRSNQPIDLLFTDVVMPGGVTGLELGRQAQGLRPGLAVLYTSGFAAASLQDDAQFAMIRNNLVTKPYRLRDLAKKVREILTSDRKSAS
jgi:two-component system cell cycle sensor histidine kinase/response regulator CckA